jgi:hypothetical protein
VIVGVAMIWGYGEASGAEVSVSMIWGAFRWAGFPRFRVGRCVGIIGAPRRNALSCAHRDER